MANIHYLSFYAYLQNIEEILFFTLIYNFLQIHKKDSH